MILVLCSSLVNKNMQKQADLAKEREELDQTIEKNKLLDEEEKIRWVSIHQSW